MLEYGKRAVLLAVAALVVAFYFWTATSGPARVQEVQDYDYYNQLTDGFLAGHLYIKYEPKPELLALRDPYDPVVNRPFRLHDASLYQGHYYIYWGPVPVLTLYLPYYLVTGWHLPEPVGVAVFGMLAYLASCRLFFALMRRLPVRLPLWMAALSVAALGMCQFAPYLLRRPMAYECAVLAGAALVMSGFYYWLRGLEDSSAGYLAAAGLSFGLAAGSRPHFALLAVAYLVVTALYLRRLENSWRALLGWKVVAAVTPVALCGLGLCWYNWARFGSLTEFGVTYQLSATRLEGVHPTWGKLLADLYYYLIAPVHWRGVFPFARFLGDPVFGKWVPKGQFVEPIAGLFATTPVYVLGFFLPFFPAWRRAARAASLRVIVWGLWGAAMGAFLFVCPLGWAIMRYALDFAPEFLILSLLVAALLIARIRARSLRWGASAVLVGACSFGIAVNTLASFTGFDNGLEVSEPQTYDRLEHAFAKLGLGQRCVSAIDFQANLTLPVNPAAGTRIVVLKTGVEPRANVVALEFVSGDRFRVRYEQGGAPVTWTQDLGYGGGSRASVEIAYRDAQRHLRIAIDGSEVLSTRALWYPPTAERSDPGVQVTLDRIQRADSCSFVPEDFELAGCRRGICAVDGKSEVVVWGNAQREGLAAGDRMRFAGAGSARILSVRQVGDLCFLAVDRALDPAADGNPHPVGRPAL